VGAVLARLGLQLNPDKTRIVHLGRGAAGFDFLGFHLHKVSPGVGRGAGTCNAGRPSGP
jgi:hypothetical protein